MPMLARLRRTIFPVARRSDGNASSSRFVEEH